MNNMTAQYGVVDLDNVRQNNIVYIDLGKPQKESIFEQQYKLAAKIIAGILNECGTATNPNRCVCDRCSSQGFRSGNILRENLTRFHTSVPFIGDRGTGKTSVMYSIWERLRNYSGSDPSAAFYLGEEHKHSHFVTMDMIDAGRLKKTDDVMEIILAQMLDYLEGFREGSNFLDLYRRIDELHKDLCHAAEEDDRKAEDFGLTNLQRVADSQDAIHKFQELVQEFLAAMSRYMFNSERCYLVIALDDVVMYQGSKWGMSNPQFALLEHIYYHLRIPGLIVLMTFNEHLLKRTCHRHFEDIYFGRRIDRRYTPTEQQDIESLTAQFLSKLFPQEKRVYMPNYMLVDALDRPNLYVSPVVGGEPIAPFEKDEKVLAVKEFMLRLVAYKTGVYFDAAGTKKHFFEPRNLRELGELFQFVCSMEDIPREEDLQEMTRIRNRHQLLDYLKNQYALRHLDEEEYKEFTGLLTLPLWRQDRTLIDKIRQHRQMTVRNPDDFGYVSGEDRWRYSYGELLHNIYFSTRIGKTSVSKDPYFRKEFMRCIFGTHSVQLNEAVRSAGSRQEILKVVGSSLAGRWANKMLPKLFVDNFDEPSGAGSISLPVREFFGWQIPKRVYEALRELGHGNMRWTRGSQYETLACGPSEVLRQFMDALVVLGMFFTNVPANGLGIRLDAERDSYGMPGLILGSDSNEHICFNVLNFAINLYDALPDEQNREEGYLARMERKIMKLGDDFAASLAAQWDTERDLASERYMQLKRSEGRVDLMQDPSLHQSKVRRLEDAKAALDRTAIWAEIAEQFESFDADTFRDEWHSILRNVMDNYWACIVEWKQNHSGYSWVLPVANFDMMYNINKRLANVSYHDIPDDADASEVYRHYLRLYDSLEEELEKQDKVYFADGGETFCSAFKDCVFYSAFTASDADSGWSWGVGFRSMMEELLVKTVSATVRASATRKRMKQIAAYDR